MRSLKVNSFRKTTESLQEPLTKKESLRVSAKLVDALSVRPTKPSALIAVFLSQSVEGHRISAALCYGSHSGAIFRIWSYSSL